MLLSQEGFQIRDVDVEAEVVVDGAYLLLIGPIKNRFKPPYPIRVKVSFSLLCYPCLIW